MKVAAVLAQYPPRTVVGAFIATSHWLTGLARRGHDVTVHRISQRPRGLREHIDGVTVLPPSGKAKWDAAHPWRQADVIISHLAEKSLRGDTAHRTAREYDIPSIRIAHSPPADGVTQLAGATLLIANSQATKEAIGWNGPTAVVHPPVFPKLHRTTPGDRVTLVNLKEKKGGPLFWKLVAELPDLQFLAVEGWGEQVGPNGNQIVSLSPHGLPGNVAWQRHTRDMRGDVWARTKVLLVPSEKESYGMVALEAMCSGIPVVAHPTPGLVEACGDAAWWVDRDDTAGWVDAVTSLADPDVLAVWSAAAVARAEQLDPQASIDGFCDAVESIR